MSTRWPGGIINQTAPVPSGPYANSTAPGIWTLEQQAYLKQQGLWPTFGNVNPDAFIENLFQTWLYTGNGSTQTIPNGLNLSGKGGLTWIKSRSSGVEYHNLFDTVRGAANVLFSNVTDAAANSPTRLSSFNSNGFTVGSNSGTNSSGGTFCSWTFREQPKFFDIVTYTGNSTARTIAHNLGSEPGMIIIKGINDDNSWWVYHRSTGNAKYLNLNGTNEAFDSATLWNSTSPTSSVFSLGSTGVVNGSGINFVAYLFAHNAGGFGASGNDNVISCGSFSSTSSDVVVNLGYEPQYLMIKSTSAGASNNDWYIFDVMRSWSQTGSLILRANTTGADSAYWGSFLIPTATGFTLKAGTSTSINYIYMAIRRPMAVPTVGTSVFSPVLYSGNSGTQSITAGFPVDLEIVGIRNGGGNEWEQGVGDRLRGNGRILATAFTSAENDWSSGIPTEFQSNTGTNRTSAFMNFSSLNFVDWMFRRAPGFFDIVCYTGTSSATTFNHNLGVVPELMIVKCRNVGGSNFWWPVYSSALGASNYLRLNATDASASSLTLWNATAPTASVFSVGSAGQTNDGANLFVAYLFASCPGVSKVGSYTGTGATQTINCGFTTGSRFVLIKRTDSTGDWYVWDSARGIVAGNDPYLLLNSPSAEVTNTDFVDTANSGFEISSTAPAAINANGGNFIFLAIA